MEAEINELHKHILSIAKAADESVRLTDHSSIRSLVGINVLMREARACTITATSG